MRRIVYTSTAIAPLTPSAMAPLLSQARANNRAAGVTGLLLQVDQQLVQLLEGPEAAVEARYASIARDGRHGRLWVLARDTVERPAFPEYPMAYAAVGAPALAALPGFSDLFASSASLRAVCADGKRAARIVEGFSDGRFRRLLANFSYGKEAAPAPGKHARI